MSAFIVDDKTINRLVSFINFYDQSGMLSSPFRSIGFDLRDSEQVERLAIELHLLNCDAVDGRYGKGTSASDVAVAFQFRFEVCHSLVAAYKLATCLLYQCSEGDVPERHLYQALERFIRTLAHEIIAAMPDYKTTTWG